VEEAEAQQTLMALLAALELVVPLRGAVLFILLAGLEQLLTVMGLMALQIKEMVAAVAEYPVPILLEATASAAMGVLVLLP